MKAPETIICVDCGGKCKLLIHPEKEIEPGDVVAYRCLECMDRWDAENLPCPHTVVLHALGDSAERGARARNTRQRVGR